MSKPLIWVPGCISFSLSLFFLPSSLCFLLPTADVSRHVHCHLGKHSSQFNLCCLGLSDLQVQHPLISFQHPLFATWWRTPLSPFSADAAAAAQSALHKVAARRCVRTTRSCQTTNRSLLACTAGPGSRPAEIEPRESKDRHGGVGIYLSIRVFVIYLSSEEYVALPVAPSTSQSKV